MSKEGLLFILVVFFGICLAFLIYPTEKEQLRRLKAANTSIEQLNQPQK